MNVGERLETLRRELGLTPEDLGAQGFVSPHDWIKIEKGQRLPSDKLIGKLMRWLVDNGKLPVASADRLREELLTLKCLDSRSPFVRELAQAHARTLPGGDALAEASLAGENAARRIKPRHANRRHRVQHGVDRALVESLTLGEAMPNLLEAICRGLRWQFGAYWNHSPVAEMLCCTETWCDPGLAATAFDSLCRQLPVTRGFGIAGRVWQSGKPEWIADIAASAEYPLSQAALTAGLHGAFAVPILFEGRCLAVIEFFHREIRPADPELLAMMTSICSQMARFLQHKETEEALARERNLLRAIIDNLPDHIYLKDTAGRYIVDNLNHLHFLGLTKPEEIIGKTVYDFFPIELARAFTADDQTVLDTGRAILNREEMRTTANGEQRWAVTTKVPFHDKAGRVIGLVCVSRDITAQRRAEENLHTTQLQLIQAEKMESLGRLAAGIAHEVKNPLAVILIGADYLSAEMENDKAASEVVKEIRESVVRADTIIREMLDFAAPKAMRRQPEDLNMLIHMAMPLIRYEMEPNNVVLEQKFSKGLPLVAIDKNKITQVIINLCLNAVHAMPNGGKLTVSTRVEQLTEGTGQNQGSRVNDRFRAGDTVVVAEIEDTGTGIPPEKLSNIFEPFFTTKETGKGTGLGLTVTKKIIDLHGGDIRIANRPEGGVRATLIFKAEAGTGSAAVRE
jgi:PAS domain S-box-containing protein